MIGAKKDHYREPTARLRLLKSYNANCFCDQMTQSDYRAEGAVRPHAEPLRIQDGRNHARRGNACDHGRSMHSTEV